jgi:threonine dehydrogenase-like Zn-dependent dehydrogenase
MISDIFPTGYFGADIAGVSDGDTVAVLGCGPVGQFAITSAFIMGAGRVFAVDSKADRLEMARAQGAEQTVSSSSSTCRRCSDEPDASSGWAVRPPG